MAFSLLASYIELKERILSFFHVVLIFIVLGQDLSHLAHKENTHSEIFSVRQVYNFNCTLFSYGSDIRCNLTWLTF